MQPRGWLPLLPILATLAIRLFIGSPLRITDDTMTPTLHPGDIVWRWHTPTRPEPGALVVWNNPDEGGLLVRRMAAVAGQTVEVASGSVVIDGHRVGAAPPAMSLPPTRIPRDHAFLLADRPGSPGDGVRWGPTPLSSLVGAVGPTLWPLGGRESSGLVITLSADVR